MRTFALLGRESCSAQPKKKDFVKKEKIADRSLKNICGDLSSMSKGMGVTGESGKDETMRLDIQSDVSIPDQQLMDARKKKGGCL